MIHLIKQSFRVIWTLVCSFYFTTRSHGYDIREKRVSKTALVFVGAENMCTEFLHDNI